MNDEYFYFGTIRKIVGAFGSQFNNIHIKHEDENGAKVVDFKVPFSYGPKNAWYEKLKQREREGKQEARTAVKLPKISCEMDALAFASDRAIAPQNVHKRVIKEDGLKDRIYAQLQDIPYDFNFTLSVQVKNIEDGLQIVEQILPYYRPNRVLNIEEIPEIGLCKEVNVDLQGVTTEDTYRGTMNNMQRIITYDFNFIVRGYIMPPLKEQVLVSEVKTLLYDGNNDEYLGNIDTLVDPIDANESDNWMSDVNASFPLD